MPCWFLEMDSSFALLTSLEAKGGAVAAPSASYCSFHC